MNPRKLIPNTKLRDHRNRRILTQADLAQHIGASETTIGRWERGEGAPTPYWTQKLCDFFNASPEELGFLPPAPSGSVADTQVEEASPTPLESPVIAPHPVSRRVGLERNSLFIALVSIVLLLSSVLVSIFAPQWFSNTGSLTPIPTLLQQPTMPPGSRQYISFEDKKLDFIDFENEMIPGISSQYSAHKSHSLQIMYTNEEEENGLRGEPYLAIGDTDLKNLQLPAPQQGQVLRAFVYFPVDSTFTLGAKLFIINKGFLWLDGGRYFEIKKGAWTLLEYVVPESEPDQIGIQFSGIGNGTIYIDAIGW